MPNENPMVHIDLKKAPIYDKYSNGKTALFFRQIDLFLLSAAYGHTKGLSKNLPQNTSSPFRWTNFNEHDKTLIKSICLSETKDPKVLQQNDKMMGIIEKYAQGGFDDLIKILEEPGEKEYNLFMLVKEIVENSNVEI